MKRYTFPPIVIYIVLMVCSVVFSVFMLVSTEGSCLDTIVSGGGKDTFMDFFNHISYVKNPQSVYFTSVHASFPPLIYFMYFLLGKILPQDAVTMYNAAETSSYALLLYVIYCVILAVFFFYSVYKLAGKKSVEWSLGMTLSLMLSNTFVFGVLERGNSALIVCILLMRALELREREDRISREKALLLIAVSAAIKIYPAVFGLLYLTEKRCKEAGRLIVYGVLFFFAPFAFFGGTRGMVCFFKNQVAIQVGQSSVGSVGALWNLLFGAQNGVIVAVIYLALAVAGCVLAKDLWKKTLLLSSIMVVAPLWSGRYTTIYMAIPLILFFRENHRKVMDYIYAALFACMFLLVTHNTATLSNYFHLWYPSAIERIAIYIMDIIVIAEGVIQSARGAGRFLNTDRI